MEVNTEPLPKRNHHQTHQDTRKEEKWDSQIVLKESRSHRYKQQAEANETKAEHRRGGKSVVQQKLKQQNPRFEEANVNTETSSEVIQPIPAPPAMPSFKSRRRGGDCRIMTVQQTSTIDLG